MAKIEELTELLVNEINTFEKGIATLEIINKNLENTKVKFDLVEFKAIKQELIGEFSIHKNTQERFNSRFENQIKKAGIYPKWAIIAFTLSLCLSLGLIFYSYNIRKSSIDNEKIAYEKGIETYNNYLQSFFENHPKTKIAFEKWKENNK